MGNQSHDVDLDRTDRLPILEGTIFDADVEDDAVVLDRALLGATIENMGAGLDRPLPQLTPPPTPVIVSQTAQSDFARPPVDLPALAESVRSVEERIARQSAEYEKLSRSFDKARDAEIAARARISALASDLSTAQSAFAVEQRRSRELERAMTERDAAMEATRARTEDALRESERYQAEARTTREALVQRDTSIAQVLHSLGERDAQLDALQREHAQVVPALEARSAASTRLEAELAAARTRADEIAAELQNAQAITVAASTRQQTGDAELTSTRRDLSSLKRQATEYLELLRTRDWRRGFDLNLFREWDAKISEAQTGQGAVKAERDQLANTVAALNARNAEQDEAIAKLQRTNLAEASALAQRAADLQQAERLRAELAARVETLETERTQLAEALTAREQAFALARQEGSGETQRINEMLHAAEKTHAAEREQLRKSREDEQAAGQRALVELRAQSDRVSAELRAQQAELRSQLEKARGDAQTEAEKIHGDRRELAERTHAEQRAQADKKHAEERAQVDKKYTDERTRAEKLHADERARADKLHTDERALSEKIIVELRGQVEKTKTEHAERVTELEGQGETHEQELAVLMAHLNEARRPIQSIQADVKRLTDELSQKSAGFDQLSEENRTLRATLERTRGALEEREFLIRRLERAESNNANVLGRIQTTMEKLGTSSGPTPMAVPEFAAELVRIDSDVTYPLGRRTRLGRAPGCELQIDSTSVSRHHALLIKSPRELIIEDLNSTNGVVVNGRKVSRAALNDADMVVIGDVQFRCIIRPVPISAAGGAVIVHAPLNRPVEAPANEPHPPAGGANG